MYIPKKNGHARNSAKKIRWGRMNRYGVMLKPRLRTTAAVSRDLAAAACEVTYGYLTSSICPVELDWAGEARWPACPAPINSQGEEMRLAILIRSDSTRAAHRSRRSGR